MERRKFLIGTGALAAGGAAALGSGAFSRVESQRQVSIQVANDENAYLGFKEMDTPNSRNYFSYDGDGHATIDISEHDDFEGSEGGAQPGEGVNSDSFTYFDGLFLLCNQGKANAYVSYELPPAPDDRRYGDDYVAPQEGYDEKVVAFYYVQRDSEGDVTNREIIDEGEPLLLELGECSEIGIRTVTKGVDATNDAPLIDGDVVVTADSPAAGQSGSSGGGGGGNQTSG
jgi:hypothetical protein